MKKIMLSLLFSAISTVAFADQASGNIKVTATIKINDKTFKKEHYIAARDPKYDVAPEEHILYREGGLVIDNVVTPSFKEDEVVFKLKVMNNIGRILAEPSMMVGWGKPAKFTCPLENMNAEITVMATYV